MPVRTLTVWGVAVVVALWLAVTSAGAVLVDRSPGTVLPLFPKNGFAYQARAVGGATARGVNGGLNVGPQQIADARAALSREPLSATSLTILGLARDANGQHADAAKAIEAAHRMDKRQLVANAWLIRHYAGLPGDHAKQVLGLLDEALKVEPTLALQYMPAFAQALRDPNTVTVFQRLLRTKPTWETEFWRAVAGNDAALPNAEVLRSRMLAKGEPVGEPDRLLMDAFIRTKRMDLALSYAKSLPAMAGDHDNLLRNSSFDSIPQMPPLDWELASDGRIGAAIDEGRGTLIINAIGGSGGTVARQLVALPPGSYQLLVKLGRADFTRGSDLRVRVHCAESDDDTIASFTEKVDTDLDRAFVVAGDSRCRFYWVDLIFSTIDSSGPASTSIAEVKIIRARAVQETKAPAEKTDGKAPE